MTITELCDTLGITATAERTRTNPNMDDSGDMTHWRVRLTRTNPRRAYTVTFSMGSGHAGRAPSADEVIDCLISDASSIDNATDFCDWAGELGYDTDSRKAERTYHACSRAAVRLRAFLGSDYDAAVAAERL